VKTIELTDEQIEIINFMLEKCEDWNYDYYDSNEVENLEKKMKEV